MAKRFPTFGKEYEFFVDEEKGVVVAKLSDIRRKFYHALEERWNVSFFDRTAKGDMMGAIAGAICFEFFGKREKELHNALRAKATCSPADTFDVAVGYNVASRKLEIKVLEMWSNLCIEIENTLDKLFGEAWELTESANDSYEYRVTALENYYETLN